MIKKGKKLHSILFCKCPKCCKGDMFVYKNPYHLNKIFKMFDKCPHCKFEYFIETGFFYGAMYASYAITVALSIFLFIVLKLPFNITLLDFFYINTGFILVTTPIIFRISRALWLHLFTK